MEESGSGSSAERHSCCYDGEWRGSEGGGVKQKRWRKRKCRRRREGPGVEVKQGTNLPLLRTLYTNTKLWLPLGTSEIEQRTLGFTMRLELWLDLGLGLVDSFVH